MAMIQQRRGSQTVPAKQGQSPVHSAGIWHFAWDQVALDIATNQPTP
jgi:hypothetical protein